MRLVCQRVSRASVSVGGRTVGEVGSGFLILVGAAREDEDADADALARKAASLRVFADEAGKMNRSLLDTGGGVLAVSQFTLLADARRGNRPSFLGAAEPNEGRRLVDRFVEALRGLGVPVQTGVFGAHMQVELVNDGPVTILLDSRER